MTTMKNDRHLFAAEEWTALRFATLLAGIASLAPLSEAASVTLAARTEGGRIAVVPDETSCASSACVLNEPDQALIGLFAEPEAGYRFKGWDGACENVVGPLCTLTPADGAFDLGAYFVRDDRFQALAHAKALLLLHGAEDKSTVWNEFVKQRFADRCPSIRGGVVIGADSIDADNQVYCYRVDFGYYDAATPKLQSGNAPSAADPSAFEHWRHEVRAAVLGIHDRHPSIELVLVGHAQGGWAARGFLRSDAPESRAVVGLLTLSAGQDESVAQRTRLDLPAVNPEEEAGINWALGQMMQGWWTRP
jgi:hypothetical protein